MSTLGFQTKCELIVVGKTVESHRMTLESEINRCHTFGVEKDITS
jgi:hypothetical protein